MSDSPCTVCPRYDNCVRPQAVALPLLLATPAAHRWVSCEPLLGPIDFIETGKAMARAGQFATDHPIDQVIVGAESGRGMRACNIEWVRDIVDQCAAVKRRFDDSPDPCFVKQLHIGGKLVTDPAEFPPDLRIRTLAWRKP